MMTDKANAVRFTDAKSTSMGQIIVITCPIMILTLFCLVAIMLHLDCLGLGTNFERVMSLVYIQVI